MCQTKTYLFVSFLDVYLKFSPAFQDLEAAFERCFTEAVVQQNDVVKYSSSALMVKSRKALHANLLKFAIHFLALIRPLYDLYFGAIIKLKYNKISKKKITGIFRRIRRQTENSNIEKYISMAAYDENYFLRTFLNGCFSMAAA